jgi:hypothetical protein
VKLSDLEYVQSLVQTETVEEFLAIFNQ